MTPAGAREPRLGAVTRQAGARLHARRDRARHGPRTGPAVVADAVKIVGWLSVSAGAIHAIAMIDHFAHWWVYGAFFLVLTYGQVLWGVAVVRKPPTDRSLKVAAVANLAILAVWLFSRTIGIPVGPEAGRPEPVGTMDGAAILVQLVLVAYVALIVRPELRSARGLRALIGVHRARIGMALCSLCVFVALLGGGHAH